MAVPSPTAVPGDHSPVTVPIALPGVVTGVALRTSFVTLGIDFGLMTIIVGHATFCVVVAYLAQRVSDVGGTAGGRA